MANQREFGVLPSIDMDELRHEINKIKLDNEKLNLDHVNQQAHIQNQIKTINESHEKEKSEWNKKYLNLMEKINVLFLHKAKEDSKKQKDEKKKTKVITRKKRNLLEDQNRIKTMKKRSMKQIRINSIYIFTN